MIYTSPYPPITLTGESITERVLRGLAGDPNRIAMIDGPTGREVTAGALEGGIRRLAGGLQARGLGKGDVVAILAPNLPEYAVVFHGVAFAGATVTTINPTYTAPEVAHQLADSGAALLVTIPAFLDTAKAAGAAQIVVIGEAEGATPLSALMGEPLAAQIPVDAAGDVAVLPYSSGTTGLPKGVRLTHRNLVANVEQCKVCFQVQPGDKVVAFLPFFHIYGQTVLMNVYLATGGTVVTMPRFDLELFLTLCSRHATPTMFIAPPVAVALAKHPLVDQFDLSPVKRLVSGAAPLSAELAEAVTRRTGVQARQGYGMTEMSPVSHGVPYATSVPGAIGVAVASTEFRIVDPVTGQDVTPGAEGELWVRGPQVMPGYHNRPEATAATLTEDGWLKTGDLAQVDEQRQVFIRDRLKELIKVKGFQVAPAEVEAALLTHPMVRDAAVRGVPDDEAGEVPVAFVVPAEGAEEGAIRAHLAGQLAHYKLPKRISFIEAIPKSASGKILRRMLPTDG
jgi:acyl-CoA synthetase (AMP-forming)/AMP-acid ligase II